MALAYRDMDTAEHSRQVGDLCVAAANDLMPQKDIFVLEIAGLLHDIGKLGVPDEILRKTGTLTHEERIIMQQHTRLGYQMLHNSRSEVMRLGAIIALRHHERFDGTGYPDGLMGDTIPLEAQIVAVADVFDALTTSRPYKPAWDTDRGLQ